MTNRQIDGLGGLLREVGFCYGVPEAGKPDQPTAEIVEDLADFNFADDEIPFRLQCANQCVRDQGHECGVEVDLGDILAGSWVNRAAAQVPWMVLSWGSHFHQLPFCCTSCLLTFVEERTEWSEARRHSHQ